MMNTLYTEHTQPQETGFGTCEGTYAGEATQTILGPVPLSVAIATTMKQLREECADLFEEGVEEWGKVEGCVSIARALSEGCTLEECGPTCRGLGGYLPGRTERLDGSDNVRAVDGEYVAGGYVDSADPEYAPVGDAEEGASTAEYGIVMLAAVGFAGLLVVILKSDEVRSMLLDIVRNALSIAGNTGLM